RALRGAIALSITGPNRKSRDLPPGVRPWLDRFEQGVDAIYLDHLFASALSPTPESAAAWVCELRDLARSIFSDATRSVRSYEVLAHAETHLNRWLPRVAA